MNHSMRVHVLDGGADLVHVALDFELMELLTATEELIQTLVGAEFKQNVDVFCIFEEMLETNNVVVVERAVDLDFRHELCFSS